VLILICTRTLRGGGKLVKTTEKRNLLFHIYTTVKLVHLAAVLFATLFALDLVRQTNTELVAAGSEPMALWRVIVGVICCSAIALTISGIIAFFVIIVDVIDSHGNHPCA